MNNIIVEVCCGSLYDALEAYDGGAQRIELNTALALGGLSPSLSALLAVKELTELEVIAMVRTRGAGFCYSDFEFDFMLKEAKSFLDNGADGIAFGSLNANLGINIEHTKKMVDLVHSYKKPAVFHRAIDVCEDIDESLLALIDLSVDRVLTSGQQSTAIKGSPLIKYLQDEYGDKIEILAGSGINETNAKELIEKCGISQIHSSCKSYQEDLSTINKDVSYAYLANDLEKCFDVVSSDKVKALLTSLK